MTGFEARTWEISLPIPMDLISANDRRNRWRQAEAVREWRAAAYTAARRVKLPKGLARVRLDIIVAPANTNKVDRNNFDPLCKAVVDGFGPPFFRKPNPKTGYKGASAPGYGLIPDDDPAHLDGSHLHLIDPAPPRGRVLVTVTDLTGVAAGRTWTPERRTTTGRVITTKRACNGCSRLLGDVTNDEIAAAIAGLPIPDVRGECPDCSAAITDLTPEGAHHHG